MPPTWDPPWWLWVTKRAIPSWGNGIALKSPFVHFFVQSEPGEAQETQCSMGGKRGATRANVCSTFESAPFTVGEDKEERRLPKWADNEVEWKVPYEERE